MSRTMSGYFELTRAELDLLCDIPVCGCQDPERFYELYRSVLAATPTPGSDRWTYGPDERGPGLDPVLWEVVNGVLDHIGATEHGGNLWGCWRTPRGDLLLDVLDRYAEDCDRTPCTKEVAQP